MQLENVILTTDNCRYCLMCRHVCPVGHVTQKETLTPHGWGLTIASVRRGLLSWNDESVEVLYSCADCGTCRSHCVTDQPLPEAIAAARAEVTAAGLAPEAAYALNRQLEAWGNAYVESPPTAPQGQGTAALFAGDEAAYLGPAALESAVRLLRCAGIEPALVGIGRNSGYLASALGFPETAAALARATLEELRQVGAGRLLVLTPGDFFTFTQLYPERLGIDTLSGFEVQEVVPLLAEAAAAGRLQLKQADESLPYAYIDPTHSVRVKGRYDAPRALLGAVLPGECKELFWRRERAHPAGNTALQFLNPALAAKLNHARLEDARESGAELLVSEDPGVVKALREQAGSFGMQVQGLYELLARQLA